MDDVSNLHKAVSAEEIYIVKTLLKQGTNVNGIDPYDGNSPLHLAAINGSKDILKLLIDNGADIKIKNNEGFTAFQCALDQENFYLVKTLIEAGDEINTKDKYGRTALHWAAMRNHIQLIQYLLTCNADVNIKNNNNETALQYACHKVLKKNSFDVSVLTILIQAGSKVNEKDDFGRTPLHWAAMNNNVVLTEKLLSCGADLNLKNNAGETVLQSAFNKSSIETAKILINAGGDVRSKDQLGQTALHYAVKDQNLRVIEHLLSYEADVNIKDNLGQTALHLAVGNNDESLVEYLLAHKANANVRNNAGETALQRAFDQSNYELAKILIIAGGEIGNRSKQGRTNLHLAVEQNNFVAATKLLSSGAKFGVKDTNKLTPLHLAVIYNDNQSHLAVLKLILKSKLNVDSQDKVGNSALLLAAKYCCSEIVKNLLSAKANPNLKNFEEETPLIHALNRKLLDMAMILVNAGAEVNVTNLRGQTSLHLAVNDENIVFIKKLLSCGARACLKDNKGLRAIDYLNKNSENFYEITNLLLNTDNNSTNLKDIKKLKNALEMHDIHLTRTLIQNGCNIHCRSSRLGRTAIHLAAQCNDVRFIELLLSRGADINMRDNDSCTPLHIASIFNNRDSHSDTIDNLLSYNADVNAQDVEGKTCLHILAAKSSPASIKLLLNYEAHINIKSNEGFTPLQYALDSRNCYIIKMFIDAGANANSISTLTGETALHLFTLEKDMKQQRIIKIIELLACDVDVNVKNNQNKTALEYLIDDCDFDLAQILIDAGANVDSRGKFGQTLLHLAVEKNDILMVKYLLSSSANANLQTFDTNSTPLHIVARSNKEEKNWRLIELLLQNNADLSCQDIKGITPFHILALCEQDLNVVKILFDAGGDINSRGINGETALHLAVRKKNITFIKYLLSCGADVDIRDKNNETPLHYAAHKGQSHLNVTKILLENKADVNSQNKEGMTSLHISAKSLDSKLIKLLLIFNADSSIENNVDKTAAQYALHNLDVAKIFIDAGVDVNVRDLMGRSVLHWAVVKINVTLLNYFLIMGADINAKDNDKFTPLLLAAVNNKNNSHLKVMKVLIANKADINAQDNNGNTLMHYVAKEANFKIIKLLITHHYKPDFNIKNDDAETPLQSAINQGELEMVKIGIKAGGDINVQGSIIGSTALHLAVLENDLETTKFLLVKGADINVKAEHYFTPLFMALIRNQKYNYDNFNVIKLLLAHNETDVNVQDGEGNTMLHFLCRVNNYDVIELFVNSRKDLKVDIKNKKGVTPLQFAIDEKDLEFARLLIDAGGDVNTKSNRDGRTASHVSVELNDVKTMKYLMSRSADINIKNHMGLTPIFLALMLDTSDCLCMMRILLANNKVSNDVEEEDCKANKSTIKSKVDLSLKEPLGFTVFEAALTGSYLSAAELLIYEAKVDVNTINSKTGFTILFIAVIKNVIPTIKNLLSLGANINARDDNDCTPLITAVCTNKDDIYLDVIKILLANKPDVNAQSKDGNTALHYSAKENSPEVIKLLIDSGIDLSIKNKEGLTALQYALEEKNLNMAKILIDAGQDVNCVNSKSETALHLAVEENKISLIKQLLSLGADISVKDYMNKTALVCALKKGQMDVAKILVEALKSYR